MHDSVRVRKNPFTLSLTRRDFLKGMGAVLLGCNAAMQWCRGSMEYGPLTESPARFYKTLEKNVVQCLQCYRKCIIAPDKTGFCDIRVNREGVLKTYSYGNPGAVNVDPIEKKPLYHFLPGTTAFSIAEIGCNIDCDFCQNWQIAQVKPGKLTVRSMDPETVAKTALTSGSPTIAYTYSEPVVWSEYVLDCAAAGNRRDVASVIISNGSWSPEVLKELLGVVSAVKVDLKSIEPEYYEKICHGKLSPVLANLEFIRKRGVWLELVNLVVPTLNDSDKEFRKMAQWIKTNLGAEVPLHFTRFHPMYRLQHLTPTPVKTLSRAREIARAEGLKYVYVGNVPTHDGENTWCPKCGKLLIQRQGYRVKTVGLETGTCKACGTKIPGIWDKKSINLS